MDRQRLFKAYLELVILFKRVNTGEVVFRLRDGRKAVLSFKIESQRLFICSDKEKDKSA